MLSLKTARKIARLSLQELSRRARVDVTLLSRLESGERTSARYETVIRIAQVLGCDPEELFPELPDAPKRLPPARSSGRPRKHKIKQQAGA